MTSLYTRDYFDEFIGRELERSRRHGIAISVASVYLMNFESLEMAQKGLGDRVIVEISKALIANTRQTDAIFRWEDDEFVILFFELTADACRKKIQQLSTLFRLWREGNGPVPYPIKVRIGAASHDKDIVFAAVLQAARAAAREDTLY